MIFFSVQIVYTGISYNMDNVGLNIYLNIIIIASCECLAYIVTSKYPQPPEGAHAHICQRHMRLSALKGALPHTCQRQMCLS